MRMRKRFGANNWTVQRFLALFCVSSVLFTELHLHAIIRPLSVWLSIYLHLGNNGHYALSRDTVMVEKSLDSY